MSNNVDTTRLTTSPTTKRRSSNRRSSSSSSNENSSLFLRKSIDTQDPRSKIISKRSSVQQDRNGKSTHYQKKKDRNSMSGKTDRRRSSGASEHRSGANLSTSEQSMSLSSVRGSRRRSSGKSTECVVIDGEEEENVQGSDDVDVKSWIAFGLIYFSYIVSYLCRKNYSSWLHQLIIVRGMDPGKASLFGSVMEAAYGVGKFVTGPLVDSASSPSRVLALSVIVAGLCNLFMFWAPFQIIDLTLWGINGFAQAAAWPALSLIFMNYFGKSPNRGTWYAVLSTSQNLGASLTPVLLSHTAKAIGWRSTTLLPAGIALVYGLVLLLVLDDEPKDSPKEVKAKKPKQSSTEPEPSITLLLSTPHLWFLGIAYGFLTLIRIGIADWSLLMLPSLYGLDKSVVIRSLVMFEMGGFLGGLSGGWLSDYFGKGNRTPTMVAMMLCAVPICFGLVSVPQGMPGLAAVLPFLYALLGFCLFGPHMLIGLVAREIFTKHPSSAGAFTKAIGQLGGTLAGYPLGVVASYFGWASVGIVFAVSGLLSSLFLGLVGTLDSPGSNSMKRKSKSKAE